MSEDGPHLKPLKRKATPTADEQQALIDQHGDKPESPANWDDLATVIADEEHKNSAGAQLLDAVMDYVRRYVVANTEQTHAITLWVAHCWFLPAFDVTGRLAVLSAEPRCGKSRVLEVIDRLVPSSLFTPNTTTAALFRSVDADSTKPPVILFDETDSVFGTRASEQNVQELRAFVNSGYRRGQNVLRMVGEGSKMKRHDFKTFAPVALAGLGTLPTTILDRSIIVKLKRKTRGERAEKFRFRDAEDWAKPLRNRMKRWATQRNIALVRAARPDLPEQLNDRAEEVWEPLLAVAWLAGGHWPARARAAALALAGEGGEDRTSVGVRLLGDCRTVFGDDEALLTATLLGRLHGLDESPWKEWGGFNGADAHPMTARELANRLRPYDVTSGDIKTGGTNHKGYRRATFTDAWSRYLPDAASPEHLSAPSATAPVRAGAAGNEGADAAAPLFDPDTPDGADTAAPANPSAPALTGQGAAGAAGTREEADSTDNGVCDTCGAPLKDDGYCPTCDTD
jgi:hypothetical protein